MYPSHTVSARWIGAKVALIVAAAALAFAAAAPGRGDDALPLSLAHRGDNLLRLHVIAHSDHADDQLAKLNVRDAVLAEMAAWPRPSDPRQLERWVQERQEALVGAATNALRELGHEHPVRVETGLFSFPPTEWDGERLPAGEYRAIRIVIGDGAGANWWCVLFPPLCFVYEADELSQGSVAHAHEATGDESTEDELEWAAGRPAGSQLPVHLEHPVHGVSWRLRLWEIIGQSAVGGVVKELVGASRAGGESAEKPDSKPMPAPPVP